MTQNSINTKNPVVQMVYNNTSAAFASVTPIPSDDTIPINTEGDEVLTCTITPTNASNILHIHFTGTGTLSCGAGGNVASIALFKDATANAIAGNTCYSNVGTEAWAIYILTHDMIAGTTSPTTFKIRAGPTKVGETMRLNADSGGRSFGGVMFTTLEIWEIKA